MESLSLEKKIETLKCPNCYKYITSDSDSCKFCSFAITRESIQAGVKEENEAIRKFQIASDKNSNRKVFSALLCVSCFIAWGVFSMWRSNGGSFINESPLITIFGFGTLIYGIYGFYRRKF